MADTMSDVYKVYRIINAIIWMLIYPWDALYPPLNMLSISTIISLDNLIFSWKMYGKTLF